MRKSEQYGLTWDCVDLDRRILTIPRSKNGEMRHIPINKAVTAALKVLKKRSKDSRYVFTSSRGGSTLEEGSRKITQQLAR